VKQRSSTNLEPIQGQQNGEVRVSRRLILAILNENRKHRPLTFSEALLYLRQAATWHAEYINNKGVQQLLLPGSLITSYSRLCLVCNWSARRVRTFKAQTTQQDILSWHSQTVPERYRALAERHSKTDANDTARSRHGGIRTATIIVLNAAYFGPMEELTGPPVGTFIQPKRHSKLSDKDTTLKRSARAEQIKGSSDKAQAEILT